MSISRRFSSVLASATSGVIFGQAYVHDYFLDNQRRIARERRSQLRGLRSNLALSDATFLIKLSNEFHLPCVGVPHNDNFVVAGRMTRWSASSLPRERNYRRVVRGQYPLVDIDDLAIERGGALAGSVEGPFERRQGRIEASKERS